MSDAQSNVAPRTTSARPAAAGSSATPGSGKPANRAVFGASFGHLIEMFDFGIYGFFVAPIAAAFFPEGSGAGGFLATLAVFGVAFLARPLGGLVFGRLGDTIGRRNALASSIILMGLSTIAIGLLPTYAQIGVLAPILLVVLRLFQGLSFGGEFGNAAILIAEHAPAERRGRWTSLITVFAQLGVLLGALVSVLVNAGLSEQAYNVWGWRLAFCLAGALCGIALYVRLRTEESPVYEQAQPKTPSARQPIRDVFRSGWRPMLLIAGLTALGTAHYMVITYFPTYLKDTTELSSGQTQTITFLLLGFLILAIPLAAAYGDRFGRRSAFLLCAGGTLVLALPGFLVASSGGMPAALGGGLMIALPLAFFHGSLGPIQAELFRTEVRATGAGIGYNVGLVAFVGMAPFIGALLVEQTGITYSPAFLVMTTAVIGMAAALRMPDTRRLRLEDAGR
ncbi:MFS transporter [Saccharomonospora sp. NPDC046836]|uniref:MFS transporter n=1 Tax=Saccharomonospora sp. NPDC046836 TaxID=3156921 RepID=UPI0033C390C8